MYGIYTSLEGYPPDIKWQVRKLLVQYMEELVAQEWPKMVKNQNDLPALSTLNQFSSLIH